MKREIVAVIRVTLLSAIQVAGSKGGAATSWWRVVAISLRVLSSNT